MTGITGQEWPCLAGFPLIYIEADTDYAASYAAVHLIAVAKVVD